MSEGSITFTPLLGASENEPLAYLLEIDGFRILLDCGWNGEFQLGEIEPLTKCALLSTCSEHIARRIPDSLAAITNSRIYPFINASD